MKRLLLAGAFVALLAVSCSRAATDEVSEVDSESELAAAQSATSSSDVNVPPAAAAPSLASTVPTTPGVQTYTMAQVQAAGTPQKCWAVIRGSVYDLTGWISRHPGGPERIEQLCGTDGTEAFEFQHGGQGKPEAQLATFKIGTLVQ